MKREYYSEKNSLEKKRVLCRRNIEVIDSALTCLQECNDKKQRAAIIKQCKIDISGGVSDQRDYFYDNINEMNGEQDLERELEKEFDIEISSIPMQPVNIQIHNPIIE